MQPVRYDLRKIQNKPLIKIRFNLIALFVVLCIASVIFTNCAQSISDTDGPYFGNGVHNGWVDQESIVIWTRLTKTPEGNMAGQQFIDISSGG